MCKDDYLEGAALNWNRGSNPGTVLAVPTIMPPDRIGITSEGVL